MHPLLETRIGQWLLLLLLLLPSSSRSPISITVLQIGLQDLASLFPEPETPAGHDEAEASPTAQVSSVSRRFFPLRALRGLGILKIEVTARPQWHNPFRTSPSKFKVEIQIITDGYILGRLQAIFQ